MDVACKPSVPVATEAVRLYEYEPMGLGVDHGRIPKTVSARVPAGDTDRNGQFQDHSCVLVRLSGIENLNVKPLADHFGVTEQRFDGRVFVGSVFEFG